MRTNLHHLVAGCADATPDAAAVTYKKQTITYAELWAEVQRVAAGLLSLGITPESRVAVFLDKRIETVAAIFGASAAGGGLRAGESAAARAQVGVHPRATATFGFSSPPPTDWRCSRRASQTAGARARRARGCRRRTPGDRSRVLDDRLGRLEPATARHPNRPRIDLDIAAILYTSGSTGKPKGVVLSHRNLIVGAESVSSYLGNTADDVILAALPLSFDAGFSQLTTAFAVGAHVVLMNYLLPGDVSRLCARAWGHRAHLRAAAVDSDRRADVAGGGARIAALLRQHRRPDAASRPSTSCERCFPHARPFLMYGLTEAFRSTYLDPAEVDRRPDSIGKAIPNAEILVVRPDGSPVRSGRGGRTGPPRRARRAGLLERPGAHRRAFPPGPRPRRGVAHPGARGVVG